MAQSLAYLEDALADGEEDLRHRLSTKGYVIPGMLQCPPCGAEYADASQRCQCGQRNRQMYCSAQSRIAAYISTLRKCNLYPFGDCCRDQTGQVVADRIEERHTYQKKHNCAAGQNCPLVITLGNLLTEVVENNWVFTPIAFSYE